jgi:hypothetical protein
VEFLVFWLLLCIIPAAIANSKGRSGAGWFLLAVLISPLIAGILAAVVSNKKTEASAAQAEAVAAQRHAEVVAASTGLKEIHAVTAIERLAALRDSGALTAEEFESKKAEMLARL